MKQFSNAGSRSMTLVMGRGHDDVGFPSPDQIRLSIQQLVSDNDIDKATTLADESLSVYPQNEGVLAISGLVAVVRNDWPRAVELLERLIAVQGDRASEFTRMMYERALNCLGNKLPTDRQTLAGAHATRN
jgi:lipopolysaccharide biosynthesis regulator YciM